MRSRESQHLQTALLVSLALAALSSTPMASTLERAVAENPHAPSSVEANGLRLVFGSVAPAAAVVWAYLYPVLVPMVCKRRAMKEL
jgi:hypothetical protein